MDRIFNFKGFPEFRLKASQQAQQYTGEDDFPCQDVEEPCRIKTFEKY